MNKQMVMKNAWKIAKQGADNFGGKAKEYLAEALKEAWNIEKEVKGYKKPQQFDPKNLKGGMTGKQQGFITKLMKEVEAMGIDVLKEVAGAVEFVEQGYYGTSKNEASELIGELLNIKKAA